MIIVEVLKTTDAVYYDTIDQESAAKRKMRSSAYIRTQYHSNPALFRENEDVRSHEAMKTNPT